MPRISAVALNFGEQILHLATDKVFDLAARKDPSNTSTVFSYTVPVRRYLRVSDPLYTTNQKEHMNHLKSTLKRIEMDAESVQMQAEFIGHKDIDTNDEIVIEVSL